MTYDVLIIGSGVGGYGIANYLLDFGVKNIALVTEGRLMGTSRNTGSDKQTYYKLGLSGSNKDSVFDLAQSLFDGGGMHGDIALAEASNSVRTFMRLVEYGVNFPHNEFGEFVGYKTDHDEHLRATSIGPLTSRVMTEKLEAKAIEKGLEIIDNRRVVKLIKNKDKICGAVCLFKDKVEKIYSKFVVLACGGEAGIYKNSVFPKSQFGGIGLAIDAGAKLTNLAEWQYGLASVKFRWNLSGSYQQVMPKYFSVDKSGIEYEFLNSAIDNPNEVCNLIFLKGYQWPFDSRKLTGSSKIDILVQQELNLGRKVFLDFRKNPLNYQFEKLPTECKQYLSDTDAIADTPIERLKKLNPQAIELFKNHNIDLVNEPLEISVCAQHINGGVWVDSEWKTSLDGLYAVGECAGTLGIYRPGGSALNSTQVGGLRASQSIVRRLKEKDYDNVFSNKYDENQKPLIFIEKCKGKVGNATVILEYFSAKMSSFCGMLRNCEEIKLILSETDDYLRNFENKVSYTDNSELLQLFKLYDALLFQKQMCIAVLETMKRTGSRGGALWIENGNIIRENESLREFVTEQENDNLEFIKRRPIPIKKESFEVVWADFNKKYL